MIDYEKLKLAHELAEKSGREIVYAYKNQEDIFVCWVTLEQLFYEMKELTKPKYKVGDIVWFEHHKLLIEAKIEERFIEPPDVYSVYPLTSPSIKFTVGESNLYPTKLDVIRANIKHWEELYAENYGDDSQIKETKIGD